jgi:competence protein ComEA
MHVYVVGAVKHPGVYALANDARVYDLVQAAGGVRPEANLVALNLAAKLMDGQEVYVAMVGEVAPTCLGGISASGTTTGGVSQLVNINTANVDELQKQLHISSKVASAIVSYRVQHGPYSSVDQLAQVVSKAIYDKIKSTVTVQ